MRNGKGRLKDLEIDDPVAALFDCGTRPALTITD
jgi:hypothetical protein